MEKPKNCGLLENKVGIVSVSFICIKFFITVTYKKHRRFGEPLSHLDSIFKIIFKTMLLLKICFIETTWMSDASYVDR